VLVTYKTTLMGMRIRK